MNIIIIESSRVAENIAINDIIENLNNSKVDLNKQKKVEVVIRVSSANDFFKENKELKKSVKLLVTDNEIIFPNQALAPLL